jgi:hypothetical protein
VEEEDVRKKAGLPGQGKVEERMRCGDDRCGLHTFVASHRRESHAKHGRSRA